MGVSSGSNSSLPRHVHAVVDSAASSTPAGASPRRGGEAGPVVR